MSKGIYLAVFLCFCSWLLPLGRFIDKAKEAKVCGGQRAVCLCSSNLAKAKSNEGGKIEVTRSATGSSQKSSSGGVGHQYLSLDKAAIPPKRTEGIATQLIITYELLLVKPIEHIPNRILAIS